MEEITTSSDVLVKMKLNINSIVSFGLKSKLLNTPLITSSNFYYFIYRVTKGKLRLEIKNKFAMIFQLLYLADENDFILTL